MPLSRDLVARFLGDNKDLRQKMGQVSKDSEGLDKRLAGFGKAARTAFGIIGVAAVGHFAKELFNVGVQAAAMDRRFDQVFGAAGGELARRIDEMNERFGVSEVRLRGLAASAGDVLVPMGLTRDAAAGMSAEILLIADALSKWTGGQRTSEEVVQIVTKSLLGEREALKGLGVSILEADVNAKVLELGMGDLTGAAREQARAQATLKIITDKSKDALDSYAKGGTDAENAASNLAAALDEVKVTLGETVVGLAPLISTVGDLVSKLNEIPGGSSTAAFALAGLAVGGPIGAAIGGVVGFGLALDGANTSLVKMVEKAKLLEEANKTLRLELDKSNPVIYKQQLEALSAQALATAGGFETVEEAVAASRDMLNDWISVTRFVSPTADEAAAAAGRFGSAVEESSQAALTAAGITQEGLRATYLRVKGDIDRAIEAHADAASDILNIWSGVPEGIDDVDIEGALARALEVAQLQTDFAADMQSLTVAGFGALVDEINRNPNKAEAVRLMDHFANDLGAALTFSEQAGISLDEWVSTMETNLAQRDRFRGINDTMFQQGVVAGERWLAGARLGASGPLGFPGATTTGQRRESQRSGAPGVD